MYGYLKKFPEKLPYWCLEGDPMGGADWVCMPQSEYERIGRYQRRPVEEAFFALPFSLTQVPQSVPVKLSAVNLVKFYVNGHLCLYGPRRGDMYSHYYDTVDIAPFLHTGTNLLAAYVVSATEKATQVGRREVLSATSVYTGMNAIALVVDGRADKADISTGIAPWRVRIDSAMNHHFYEPSDLLGSFEDADLARMPRGWNTDPAVCQDWVPAETMFKPGINYYGQIRALPLVPRPFSRPSETPWNFQRTLAPHDAPALVFDESGAAVVPPHRRAAVILDAGEHTTCFVSTHLAGAGAVVRFTYAESFLLTTSPDGRQPGFLLGVDGNDYFKQRRDDENGVIVGAYDEVQTAQDCVYEPFRIKTFRFLRIDIKTGALPLTIHRPELRLCRYPLDVRTHISTSDEDAMWLWDASLRTVRNCMHDTFESDAYYEQLQYIQDTKLMMDFVYALSPDTDFPAATLWDFHSSLRPDGMLSCSYPSNEIQVIPGFSLQFIWMLERYYHHTADEKMIAFYRPTMDAILAYFDRHRNDDGLCEGLGYWEFADWSTAWNACHGRPDSIQHGPATIFNLMYAFSLQLAAHLNDVTGRPALAAEYQTRAARVLESVQKHCWSESAGMLMEAPGFPQYSQHCQALGVLTGLLCGETGRRALQAALSDSSVIECSLPWRYYLFRALEKYQMYAPMRARLDSFARLRADHLTTMPEWSLDGPRSDCHPWSCTPLYEFPATVLGVRPAQDGWKRILIQPCPMGYHDFSGSVCTPHGPVEVKWVIEDAQMKLSVNTPFDTIVATPDGRKYCVTAGNYSFTSPIPDR